MRGINTECLDVVAVVVVAVVVVGLFSLNQIYSWSIKVRSYLRTVYSHSKQNDSLYKYSPVKCILATECIKR